MREKVQFVFWDGPFRLLSTGPAGSECGSRAEAMQMLFEQVAAKESTVGYLNQIYDNAQVELQPDNMQEVTVRGAYDLRDVYIGKKAQDIADTVLTYVPSGEPVGLAYALKSPEDYGPDFEEALGKLMSEMKKRGQEYLAEERRLLGH